MKTALSERILSRTGSRIDLPARPKISRPLLYLFAKYSERFLRRNFHGIRLLRRALPAAPSDMPLVIYLNHPSWWDPLVCLLLARRFFPARESFAPIEASALERYRFFRTLGFFGVETSRRAGAWEFLGIADAILSSKRSALWLTPQGSFVDSRVRPVHFQRGLSFLTRRVKRAAFVPLALEYAFWEERDPEVLVGFGAPLIFEAQQRLSVSETTQLFETALTSVQDQVAAASQRRDPEEWEQLARGATGSSRVYDLWRRARARFRGEKFVPSHSSL